jgi:hypothetical protein
LTDVYEDIAGLLVKHMLQPPPKAAPPKDEMAERRRRAEAEADKRRNNAFTRAERTAKNLEWARLGGIPTSVKLKDKNGNETTVAITIPNGFIEHVVLGIGVQPANEFLRRDLATLIAKISAAKMAQSAMNNNGTIDFVTVAEETIETVKRTWKQ